MPKKYKLFNLSSRCRICLHDHGCMTDLFDNSLDSKLKDLSQCTSIDIKNEQGLPNIICHLCLYKLELWHEFKEQFIQSNKILLSHLETSEASGNVTPDYKRKHAEASEDSLSDNNDKKRTKSDVPPLIPLELTNDCTTDKSALKETYISEDEPASSKDSSQKDATNTDKQQEETKEGNEISEMKSPMKYKSVTTKRGKTTERRKASTKRWVARKKALLAATGEKVSDTDSIDSDGVQLSPVQKARAKTNADKEAERHKRLAKELKNLETNMSGKYSIKHDSDSILMDTDLDVRKTRSVQRNQTISQNDSDSKNVKPTQNATRNSERNKSSFNINDKHSSEIKESVIIEENKKDELLLPLSIKSELEIGGAMYIVTSTLSLAEDQFANKGHVNNVPKESKSLNLDESSQEKNTDIIDAVQLRRINPATTDTNERKQVEKCLNIEVEGTELQALKQVQVDLASFVEKEMKQRLLGEKEDNIKEEESQTKYKSSYKALDQKLKNIVEKTIKKNFNTSLRKEEIFPSNNSGRISPASIQAAETSKKYQPKVVLKILDLIKENKYYKINNLHVLEQCNKTKSELDSSFGIISGKRRRIPCRRYNDYNTSTVDSDSNEPEGSLPEVTPALANTQRKVYGPASRRDARKQSLDAVKEHNVMVTSTPFIKKSDSTTENSQKKIESQNVVIKAESPVNAKHICGVCGQSFNNRTEIEIHIKSHKTELASRQNKHKLMRCKRCHEIVEARFVKTHVCRSTKEVHKCHSCNSVFRTHKLLACHLETHFWVTMENKLKTENVTQGSFGKADLNNQSSTESSMAPKEQIVKKSNTAKRDNSIKESAVEKTSENLVKGAELTEKPKEIYTCFVCNKTFTDEEVLKDHLQKHCDDISEDEQNTSKEQFQCAICGESMQSEDALESHVEKHLFDDEDDNPNLITIGHEKEEKAKEISYQCMQCSEKFSSEMLLEMHMQAHEEEAAIAEWEKQGMKACEYQCMICDELFETEEELSEHLDVHNGNAHVCQLCEKPFPTLADLQKHVDTH